MKILNTFIYSSLLLLFSIQTISAKEDYRIENQPVAFEQALSIPAIGTLKQNKNGFIYLDVENAYISEVIPLMNYPGEIRPRPTTSKSIGAHISVFHEKEAIQPLELGEQFLFNIQDIRSFTLHTRDGLKKLWVISTDSPELETLRESYGLSPKLKGYDYHIALGKQMPTAPDGWQDKHQFSRFEFSDEPTEGLYSQGDFVVVDNPAVLETARKVNQVGQLCLKSNGFVYVNVEDSFVEDIVDIIPFEGDFKPTSTGQKMMGAHISVFYEDEVIGHEIWDFEDAGDWFTFEVKELRYIQMGNSRLWVLAVEAPGLERLRKHHGMKSKLKGHYFYITIGHEKIEQAAFKKAA